MKFKIATAQYPLHFHSSWKDWEESTKTWVHQARDCQILVFPEYGSLDLTSLLKEEERTLGRQVFFLQKFLTPFLETFEKLAKEMGIYILAPSIPVYEKDKPVNRAFFFGPQGSLGFQDKIKMTRFEKEDWLIHSSPQGLTCFSTEMGPVGVCICYDVEFPQFAKYFSHSGAKILLAPSCTETKHGLNRVHTGARARALENQFIVAVASTVGEAPWSPAVDINSGQALVAGPSDLGFPEDGIITKGEFNKIGWIKTDLDLTLIEKVRQDGSVLNYQDSFSDF
ncbi:MAG: carbon-nitrogen hydrolase family protein [Bdellovibrionales bacterium]